MWNTGRGVAAGEADEVMSRGQPSKHNNAHPHCGHPIPQEEKGTVRAEADTIEAMDIDEKDVTEQGDAAWKEPHTQQTELDHRNVAIP